MDKYKHRVSFRLEKRKDKSGNLPEELPINADITFGGKRIWYYSGYRIAIATNMARSMTILTGILLFNIYVHDIHDDVHGINNLYRNL